MYDALERGRWYNTLVITWHNPIALPECAFRYREFRAPDRIGGDSNGPRSSPQNPIETPSPNSSFPTEQTQTDEIQQTLQAVGLATQSLNRRGKRIDLPTEDIATEYLNGTAVTEMAQRHKVSTRTIYRRLHEAGLPRHAPVTEHIQAIEKQFCWWRDLSLDAQKLYKLLIGEGGDTDTLPIIASKQGFDLNAALDEVRRHDLLDESDPSIVRLSR